MEKLGRVLGVKPIKVKLLDIYNMYTDCIIIVGKAENQLNSFQYEFKPDKQSAYDLPRYSLNNFVNAVNVVYNKTEYFNGSVSTIENCLT